MDEGRERWAVSALEVEDMAAALDLPAEAASELADVLRTFYREAFVAVPSLVGMTVTCRLPSGDAVLTALQPSSTGDEIAASLQLSLPLPGGPDAAVCLIVLYADQPDAFADLADALRDGLGEDSGELLLDRHLESPVRSDLSAFRHAAVQDMAEGVLLGRGFSEIGATTFMEALTAASAGDVGSAARQVIRSVR
jgi:hypothetical protein